MSSSRISGDNLRRAVAWAAIGAALVLTMAPALAWQAPSTPSERQRFAAIAHSLEQAPLRESLKDDRAWALDWLTRVPDIGVTLCADVLGRLVKSKYRHGGEIVIQDSFSMAAFIIEHPDAAKDPAAQQLAGVEGALKAYRAILAEKPNARSPELDNLLRMQARGELGAFVANASASCSKK